MRNKSVTYFLPLIIKYVPLRISDEDGMLIKNTYLYYEGTDDPLFIVVYEDRIPAEHINLLVECNYVLEINNTSDGIVLVIDIPNNIFPEYTFLTNGQYSKFSDEAKQWIIKTWINRYPQATKEFKDILYKSPYYRAELAAKLGVPLTENMELSSIPRKDLETFKP